MEPPFSEVSGSEWLKGARVEGSLFTFFLGAFGCRGWSSRLLGRPGSSERLPEVSPSTNLWHIEAPLKAWPACLELLRLGSWGVKKGESGGVGPNEVYCWPLPKASPTHVRSCT